MQAIARVNRVYGDKPGGLIVDLLGLADQLADALATYTQAGGTGEAVRNVQNEAVPAMQAAFEKLRGFFHGCDYEQALDAKPQAVLLVYLRAIDHVFGQNDGWKRLRTLVKELSAAFALAVPRPETDAITPHLAFFQRVVAMIRKRLADDIGSGAGHARQRDIDAAVRQVIGGAIDADEVIDLFAVAGLSDARLDILSDEFLGRVAALEQKNLALETLRKLLNDQIRITERTNIVQSRKFREALEDAMLRYTNKAITTAEMISQLIRLGEEPARRAAARRRTRPKRRGNRLLRRPGGERVSQRSDAERHATSHGPGTDRNGQEDAQARLDPARVGTGKPAAQCSPAAGKVRLPSGSGRRRDAARLATGGIVNGELGVNQDGLAPQRASWTRVAGPKLVEAGRTVILARESFTITGLLGIHLTGASARRAGNSPWSVRRRAFQAGWVPTGSRRRRWLHFGCGVNDEVSVAHRVVRDGELEHPVEHHPAAAGAAAVEAEHELIQVAGQVRGVDRALVRAQQPPLDQ